MGGASTYTALIQNTVRLKLRRLRWASASAAATCSSLPTVRPGLRIRTGTLLTFTGSGVTAGSKKNLSKGTNPSEPSRQVM